MHTELVWRWTPAQRGRKVSVGCEGKQVGTSGVKEQVLFGYSSPPEAQGEYVIYSPEIYRATA